jgi:tetratricopeptide (TPR) repeat protein
VYREADIPKALELAERALAAASDADELARFGALDVRALIAKWQGKLDESERYEHEALLVARAAKRKDLESKAALSLAHVYLARMEHDEAAPLLERALELAEASGSLVARAHAAAQWGDFLRVQGEPEAAEVSYRQALELYSEAGAAAAIGQVGKSLGWLAWENGDPGRAEKLLRESIRQLTPLQDRGTLCESQRLLAQLLLASGRVDEAEQLALAARETVGPEDLTSRATTRVALAQVRAAQGQDEEAETLFREALDIVAPSQYRRGLYDVVPPYAEFLRARGRDAEADELERTLPTVPDIARSAAPIA